MIKSLTVHERHDDLPPLMGAERTYLDHNATTPLRPEVQEVLRRFAGDPLMNPSSVHQTGHRARKLVDDAREDVASLLGAQPSEIIFLSSGTESNHLAWNAFATSNKKIATTAVEHSSVLATAARAETAGARVAIWPVLPDGSLNEKHALADIGNGFDFISIQHANNETGIVYPVDRIVKSARLKRSAVHTDAVQTVGKLAFDVHDLGVDYLSLSGHKLGTPSGIGALYVRKGSPLEPIFQGGPQEKGRRGGTENALGILCLAAACRAILEQRDEEIARITRLRDRFEGEMKASVEGITITGKNLPRLPNTSHILFEDCDGESLMIAADLEGIDCSMGSACSSGSLKPSHVLLAMGIPVDRARSAIRFSLGWNTTESEIDKALLALPKLVAQVRNAGHNYVKRKAL